MTKVSNPELAKTIAEKVKGAKQEKTPATPVHMKHYANEQTSIIRQVCVKAAAHALSSKASVKAKDIITMAEELEAWITR